MAKRQHDRYDAKISCELVINEVAIAAETRNLSEGGAAIVGHFACKQGDVATISFFLTEDGIEDVDETPFESGASIRWTKPTHDGRLVAGVQFIAPSSALKAQLRRFLERAGQPDR